MKIGFTGTRNGMTEKQKDSFYSILIRLSPVHEFHHGCCLGADEQAHYIAENILDNNANCASEGCVKEIHIHPPTNTSMVFKSAIKLSSVKMHPAKDYLVRNKDIVNAIDWLIATPDGPERLRSGTWSTIRYAKKSNKSVCVIMPDGKFG